jgi:hypothetical protein
LSANAVKVSRQFEIGEVVHQIEDVYRRIIARR